MDDMEKLVKKTQPFEKERHKRNCNCRPNNSCLFS